jgi:hypothetical protein
VEELKKALDNLGKSLDRNFDLAELRAWERHEQLIATLQETSLAETKRFEELMERIQERRGT